MSVHRMWFNRKLEKRNSEMDFRNENNFPTWRIQNHVSEVWSNNGKSQPLEKTLFIEC